MIYAENICFGCDHFCDNNDDGLLEGCRAFPDGIPTEKIGAKHSHDKKLKNQNNEFVYKPAERLYDNLGQRIIIYQK